MILWVGDLVIPGLPRFWLCFWKQSNEQWGCKVVWWGSLCRSRNHLQRNNFNQFVIIKFIIYHLLKFNSINTNATKSRCDLSLFTLEYDSYLPFIASFTRPASWGKSHGKEQNTNIWLSELQWVQITFGVSDLTGFQKSELTFGNSSSNSVSSSQLVIFFSRSVIGSSIALSSSDTCEPWVSISSGIDWNKPQREIRELPNLLDQVSYFLMIC